MQIPPPYTITDEILSLIAKIESLRLFFSSANYPPKIVDKIKRVSLLKSSLYSARIEGNPLELSDLELKNPQEQKRMEIFNIIDATNLIDSTKTGEPLSKSLLLKLHSVVLKNISSDAGQIRSEVSAIFNQANVAVYLPPRPSQINPLLDKLFKYINSKNKRFPLITSFLSHLIFEKIHPFLDGNGRVGRLLISAVLKSYGFKFTFTVPFEEYLDTHKSEYYFHLDKGLQNTNDYLIFMLEAYLNQLEELKKQLEEEVVKNQEFLSPRQEEIVNIIKDHLVVSFDTIKRRFLKVPDRTLRYDLKKLVDKNLVEKTGKTKGRYYRIRKN